MFLILFPPKSAKTILGTTPNDARGILPLSAVIAFIYENGVLQGCSDPTRGTPRVLHALGAMMTVVNTNNLKIYTNTYKYKYS